MGTPCQPQRPFNRPGRAGRRPPWATAPWARFLLVTALLVAGGLACLSPRAAGAEAETVEVVNTSDSGAGSLRAAIDYANAHPGTQVVFHIPLIDSGYADGVFTIRPTSALPALSATSASLDGDTQTAFSGDTNPVGPEVVLNGALAGSATSGIEITGSACLIRAFVVNGFARNGVLVSSGPGGHRIEACYVGTDPTGMAAVPNATGGGSFTGVSISSGTGTVVGGTAPGAGNLLSGNGNATVLGDGVAVNGAETTGTRIEGNLIGTDRTGSGALGNSRSGVSLYVCGADTVVGGEEEARRNVISGNGQSGVQIGEVTAAGTVLAGNFIGTNRAGTLRLANLLHGVNLSGSSGVTIGGATAGRRNLISGNYFNGVFLSTSTGNTVIGNYIGTDVTGTVAIPNSWVQAISAGVYLGNATGNRVGGAAPGEGNLISGNDVFGIIIDWSSDNDVQGNRIGTNAAGTAAVPNQVFGIYIASSGDNRIGGTAPGMRNLISGNTLSGVYIENSRGSTIRGNWIGVDITGAAALGNSDNGVKIVSGASGNVVGGTEPGAENRIAFNAAAGVALESGTGNSVLGNAIFGNGLLGLDLGPTGVTANDAGDGDAGANNQQNYPVLQAAYAGPSAIALCGQFDAPSAETCRLEFFSNAVQDPSGYGEGQTYLGSGAPTADGVFAVTLSATVSVGSWVTATATDAAGNTSEFGLCVAVSASDGDSLPDAWEWRYWQNLDQAATDDPDVDGFTNAQEVAMGTDPTLATSGPGTLLFGAAASSVAESAGTATVSVLLSSAVAEAVSVQYAISDGSATAGSDYSATGGTLSFEPGQTAQTLTVPVTDDMLYEGNETLTVTLSNPTHAALGVQRSHTLTILDDEDACTVTTTADSGTGSLRAAIGYANAHPRTQILFHIPLSDSGYANGVFTIQPLSTLPFLSATSANLDGGTQTAFTGDTNPVGPEVVLNGALAGSATSGIEITGFGCLIRALVVNGFAYTGVVVLSGLGHHRIEACYIGTDPTGTLAVPNGRGSDYHGGVGIHGATGTVVGGTSPGAGNLISGNGTDTVLGDGIAVSNLEVSGTRIEGNLIGTDRTGTVALGNSRFGAVLYLCGANNVIGGEVAAARNVISGNRQSGVAVGEATAAGTVVSGNYIGTDLTGTLRLANLQHGVDLWNSRGVTIGGTIAGRRNLISGNVMNGVYFRTYGGGPTGDTIIGNYIGTDASGAAALGNGGSGVRIVPDASGNAVGGTDPGTGNRIAFNAGAGVALESGTGNAVLGNAIFSNGLLGIDLGPTGVTANDAGDSDAGRNNQQNFPVIQAALAGSGTAVVLGTLDTPSPQTCRVEVFASDVRDPSGYGEGQTYLGSGTPTAGGSFVVTLNATVTVGTWVTATATDAGGNTSEFSRAVTAVADDDPDGDGLINLQEYAIGSDPNDPLSGLEVVFTSADAGTGSLRAALAYANAHPGTTIRFALPTSDPEYDSATGTFSIRPASPLPAIAGAGTAIDGTTQATFGGDTNPLGPEVVISGGAAPADTSGLTVAAANCRVAGLVINGFPAHGICINSGATATVIRGCYIGTDASGSLAIGNGGDGVRVTDCPDNRIGGTAAGDPNRISGNGGCGILVCGATATGNQAWANSIYGNGGLGIDLAAGGSADGVTANDAGDADPGPNALQNYPVLQAVYAGPSTIALCGQFDAPSAAACRLEFFSNAVQDPSGYGEGQTYLGSGTAAASGVFAVTLSATVSVGSWVTVTATDAAGNTSEFALALAVTVSDGDALPDAWEWRYWQNLAQAATDDPDVDGFTNAQEVAMGTDPTLATSGPDALYLAAVSSAVAEAAGTATLAVQLSNAVARTVTVHYATSDGSATAGSDYSATSGTLSFAPGQTTQTITVPVTDDMLYEGNETLTVTLSNPVNAALGTASQTVTILDNEDVCTVTTTADSGTGSLRAAIDYANAHPRTQVLFHIPLSDSGYANGVYTIQPLSALPALRATAANLDGGTQTAFTGDTNPVGPEVVLNGALAGSVANGIEIFGSGCLIRALVVNGFAYNGVVVVAGPGGHRIEACYIGTDPTGMLAVPNVRGQNYQAGVNICSGTGTVIGGTRPGAGNLLSGNGNDTFQGDGIVLYWAETTGTRIEGNLIGTDRTGTGALGNSQYGVALYMCGANNVIGGEGAAARNVISGNWQHGVGVGEVTAAGTVLSGNSIGTDRTGTLHLANQQHGVDLWGSSGVTIGGTTTGAGNRIAFNAGAGVSLRSGTGNAVRGNAIAGNGLLGLDLGSSGVTANDTGDGDTGANNQQNFPVIQAAYAGATEIEIHGTLDTPNRQTCTLDFYANDARDAGGYGEGSDLPRQRHPAGRWHVRDHAQRHRPHRFLGDGHGHRHRREYLRVCALCAGGLPRP